MNFCLTVSFNDTPFTPVEQGPFNHEIMVLKDFSMSSKSTDGSGNMDNNNNSFALIQIDLTFTT